MDESFEKNRKLKPVLESEHHVSFLGVTLDKAKKGEVHQTQNFIKIISKTSFAGSFSETLQHRGFLETPTS